MESHEVKETDIENRAWYYFDGITKTEDFDFDILIDAKSCKNILVYKILYKNLFDSKPLRIRFDDVDGFIKVCDGIRYLVLFGSERYDAIYNRIRYLISQKSFIAYVFSHNYAKSKVNSFDSLPPEKTLTLRNVIIRS